jgi:hypothetical protein
MIFAESVRYSPLNWSNDLSLLLGCYVTIGCILDGDDILLKSLDLSIQRRY